MLLEKSPNQNEYTNGVVARYHRVANCHLRHGEVVHKDCHLLAPRRTEVLTPAFIQLNFDRVLAHERGGRAREVDPGIC